jgi:hypothetical protein
VTDLRASGSRAVVIGASSYLSGELANVPAVLDTVSDLRTALIERCGMARDAIRFMPDWPDAASVGSALAREAERTEGVLLVYYAGHGLVSQRGELYLAMGETDPASGQLEHTALSYDMVRRHLQYSPARACLVILDCCFSSRALTADGSGRPDGGLAALTGVEGGVVLASAAREEHALVREGDKYTAFTGHLLTLLADGDPASPQLLTPFAIYRYLDRELSAAGLPRPRRLSSGDADDIVIADNAARRSPPASDDAPSGQRPALIPQTPAAYGAGAPGAWSADVVAAATHSYLTWLTETNDRITVTGLTGARGTLNVPLERVYTALRLDQSSRAERAAAAENLWRELERELLARDLSPDEEDNLRWILYADLPTADYLVAGATGEKGKLLHVGEVYQRDNAMVILGDPGSGKTTIMRWLTLVHAQTLLRGEPEVSVQRMHVDAAAQDTEEEAGDFVLGQPLLPIPVRVAEYAADRQQRRRRGEQPRSLLQFLGHHSWNRTSPVWTDEDSAAGPQGHPIEPELLGHVLGTALRERRALVILDGLDEVPAEERTAVSDAIAEFVARWVPRRIGSRPSNKVIITSRIAGYQLAPLSADLTQVTIEKMTDTALGVFVRNWMREVLAEMDSQSGSGADQQERTVEDARALAAQLTGLIAEPMNRYVRDLATNPMLAAVIVAIFINQGNALPSQRVEVYQSAVETLISVWSERLSRTYDEIESHALFEAIPAVAAHVHATKANGVILAAEFRDHLLEEVARIEGTNPQRPSPALQASVGSLLQIMRVELGLLVESGPGAFRFSHLTFQEFLAAQHLVSDPGQRARRILAHLGDPRWREPILMALGLVNWQHPGQIAQLTTDLLAENGPLGDLFPEPALLLAAAVPQMTMVPGDIVRSVARKLVESYSALARTRRLPRVRESIENAIAALRTEDHILIVDDVLASALTSPAGNDDVLSCTTASLIKAIDATSPGLARAMTEAAGRWDRADLGSPIIQALTSMVSPAGIPAEGAPASRLEAGWGAGMLPMREWLSRRPELTNRVRGNPRWLALMLSLYGGYWQLGAAEALDQYQRMAFYLNLADDYRKPYEIYFAERWGRDDPIYSMAVYLDTTGVGLKRKWTAAPAFTPEAIVRDSPFNWQVTQALSRDDLPDLVRFLRSRAASGDLGQREEAMLALWALGDEAGRPGPGGAAARRVDALGVGLRDSVVQAGPRLAGSLAELSGKLAADRWERLHSAVNATLIHAGALPLSMRHVLGSVPRPDQAHVLGEELTIWIGGADEDDVIEAEAFVDAADRAGYSYESVIAAVNDRGTARSNGYRRYAHYWAADSVTFPYQGEADIPLAVLDQLQGAPRTMSFFPEWLFRNAIAPVIARNPQLLPEVLAIIWAGWLSWPQEFREDAIARLDAVLPTDSAPVERIMAKCREVSDPWHQARGLLRAAACFPDHAAAARQAASALIERVTDPVRAFQLHERLVRLGPPDEARRHQAACQALADTMTDPAATSVARLRLATICPPGECEGHLLAAVAAVAADGARPQEASPRLPQWLGGQRDSRPPAVQQRLRQRQLRLLQHVWEDFPDCLRARDAVHETLTALGATSEEEAWVECRWGVVIAANLAEQSMVGATEDGPAGYATTQVWAPLALYARAADVGSFGQRDASSAAWERLAAVPSPQAVTEVLASYDAPFIPVTGVVARRVTRALDAAAEAPGAAGSLRPLLSRLVQVGPDAEPAVRSWLRHPESDGANMAALLLAESRGLTPPLAAALTGQLLSDDDLCGFRARAVLGFGGNTLSTSVSRIGRRTVEHLTQFAHDRSLDFPAAAVAVNWFLEGVVHDDPEAIAAWCAAEEAPGVNSPKARILGWIAAVTDPAWLALLDGIRHRSPGVRAHLLRSCACMLNRSRGYEGEWSEYAVPFRIGASRWRQLWDVLRATDPEPLRACPVLFADPEAILAAAATALALTGGNLDQGSSDRASLALAAEAGSSVGEILAAGGESAVLDGLARFGQSQLAQINAPDRALRALDRLREDPQVSEWPWTGLLADWATDLLAQSVRDEDLCWERCTVIEVLAAIAERNPDTFRRYADTETLTRLLAAATRLHNGWPGRRGAAQLLGILRHGSAEVLNALEEAMRDVPQVREAALYAIPRLRNVDHAVVDGLIAALSGHSAINAWAAAQLLTIIGQNTATPSGRRQAIISALALAVRGADSRRPVHFAFTEAAIPQMPELDDVFTEAIQRIYRFG